MGVKFLFILLKRTWSKNLKSKVGLFAWVMLISGCAAIDPTARNADWGYNGHEGPEYWGSLSPDYSTCSTGKNQAPVNLTGFVESDLKPLQIRYAAGGNSVMNNGHTVQVNYQSGSHLSVNGHTYELKQFHFHSPSENHINGQSYPLEAHLVHTDDQGNLAVIAILFEAGDGNRTLDKIWAAMPQKAGDENNLSSSISVEGILPANRDYYRFSGSLTTPPCSEGVLWLVMKQPLYASDQQIDHFSRTLHHPNNRPLQPLYARAVLQ